MAARAWLVDRRIEVDAKAERARVTPMRWPGLLFVPAFASTPISLFWVQFYSGTSHLSTAGWFIMVGYAVLTVVMAVMFLSPRNRPISIDFAKKRMSIGSVEAPFDQISLTEQASVRVHRGQSIPRSKLVATIGTQTFTLLDLANDAAQLPGALARAIQNGDIEGFERETGRAGNEQGKKFVMTLVLMLAPGLMFAYAAIF